MTLNPEKIALDERLTRALNRPKNKLEAHVLHPDEKDALNAEIRVTEERIENRIARKKALKFRGQLAAIARERKKHKGK